VEGDAIFIKVNVFLSELESRLDWLENYGNLKMDDGINRAYATLAAVRDSCSQVSGELMDAGRHRAKVLVEVLEARYKDALATKGTLESKAQASIRLMEAFLSEFESRAQTVRGASFTKVMDEGWRRAEDGLRSAREAVDEGVERVWRAKDSLKENVEHAVKRAKEVGLITYEELPHPWRVNPHITKGYRFSSTKVECVRSAFSLSNESFNIWSHAIGLLIVLSIAFYYYPASFNFSQSSKTDIFFSAMFFFAACKCLICSCMWHTMNSIADQTLMERFACVDYTGISLLIAASIMTTEYTAFYVAPHIQPSGHGLGTSFVLRCPGCHWLCSHYSVEPHKGFGMVVLLLRPGDEERFGVPCGGHHICDEATGDAPSWLVRLCGRKP